MNIHELEVTCCYWSRRAVDACLWAVIDSQTGPMVSLLSDGDDRFLRRDAKRKSDSSRWQVSVCPFVTFVYFIQTGYRYPETFCQPGNSIIFYFWAQMPLPNSKRNPLNGYVIYTRVGKFEIFDWNGRLSRKQYQKGLWLLWKLASHR